MSVNNACSGSYNFLRDYGTKNPVKTSAPSFFNGRGLFTSLIVDSEINAAKKFADSKNILVRHIFSRIGFAFTLPTSMITRVADAALGLVAATFALITLGKISSLNNFAYRNINLPGLIPDMFFGVIKTINPWAGTKPQALLNTPAQPLLTQPKPQIVLTAKPPLPQTMPITESQKPEKPQQIQIPPIQKTEQILPAKALSITPATTIQASETSDKKPSSIETCTNTHAPSRPAKKEPKKAPKIVTPVPNPVKVNYPHLSLKEARRLLKEQDDLKIQIRQQELSLESSTRISQNNSPKSVKNQTELLKKGLEKNRVLLAETEKKLLPPTS